VVDRGRNESEQLCLDLFELRQIGQIRAFELISVEFTIGGDCNDILAVLERMMHWALKNPVFFSRQDLGKRRLKPSLTRVN